MAEAGNGSGGGAGTEPGAEGAPHNARCARKGCAHERWLHGTGSSEGFGCRAGPAPCRCVGFLAVRETIPVPVSVSEGIVGATFTLPPGTTEAEAQKFLAMIESAFTAAGGSPGGLKIEEVEEVAKRVKIEELPESAPAPTSCCVCEVRPAEINVRINPESWKGCKGRGAHLALEGCCVDPDTWMHDVCAPCHARLATKTPMKVTPSSVRAGAELDAKCDAALASIQYATERDAAGNIVSQDGRPVSKALSDLIRFDEGPVPECLPGSAADLARAAQRAKLIAAIEREQPSTLPAWVGTGLDVLRHLVDAVYCDKGGPGAHHVYAGPTLAACARCGRRESEAEFAGRRRNEAWARRAVATRRPTTTVPPVTIAKDEAVAARAKLNARYPEIAKAHERLRKIIRGDGPWPVNSTAVAPTTLPEGFSVRVGAHPDCDEAAAYEVCDAAGAPCARGMASSEKDACVEGARAAWRAWALGLEQTARVMGITCPICKGLLSAHNRDCRLPMSDGTPGSRSVHVDHGTGPDRTAVAEYVSKAVADALQEKVVYREGEIVTLNTALLNAHRELTEKDRKIEALRAGTEELHTDIERKGAEWSRAQAREKELLAEIVELRANAESKNRVIAELQAVRARREEEIRVLREDAENESLRRKVRDRDAMIETLTKTVNAANADRDAAVKARHEEETRVTRDGALLGRVLAAREHTLADLRKKLDGCPCEKVGSQQVCDACNTLVDALAAIEKETVVRGE